MKLYQTECECGFTSEMYEDQKLAVFAGKSLHGVPHQGGKLVKIIYEAGKKFVVRQLESTNGDEFTIERSK